MSLVKDNALIEDPFTYVPEGGEIPADDPVIVHLDQWRAHRDKLSQRDSALGVRLKSDESPELIADDLNWLAVVALEFPAFRDGRAYSYARILRERYGFTGEVRAVGDILREQLHFMLRTGFNAFEIAGDDPLGQIRAATEDFTIWYQPTDDGRATALQRRHQAD
ncbi:DUF934 domain-containing protein [Candidatus Rariloculus sp.]|uniref:DUF934 domain-containing protein n=1 Tax=Candidatus Rariloculus sp. TaxID=3101265 RepID=UPI003D0C8BB9